MAGSSRGKPNDEETGSLVPAVAAPKEAFPAQQALRLMPTHKSQSASGLNIQSSYTGGRSCLASNSDFAADSGFASSGI